MGLSPAYRNKVLAKIFRKVDFTPPASYYLAIHTGIPGATGLNAEASGGGYSRKAITFAIESNGVILNGGADIETANFPAGKYTHFSIHGTTTGGADFVWEGKINGDDGITVGSETNHILRLTAGMLSLDFNIADI